MTEQTPFDWDAYAAKLKQDGWEVEIIRSGKNGSKVDLTATKSAPLDSVPSTVQASNHGGSARGSVTHYYSKTPNVLTNVLIWLVLTCAISLHDFWKNPVADAIYLSVVLSGIVGGSLMVLWVKDNGEAFLKALVLWVTDHLKRTPKP